MLEELSQRASKMAEQNGTPSAASAMQPVSFPHLVVIVHDYVDVRQHPALTHAFKLGEQLGVSVIYLVAQQQAIPSECRGILRLSDEWMLTYAGIGFAGETFEDVHADKMQLEDGVMLARSLPFMS